MDGPVSTRRRRRLIEACLAVMVLCGVSVVLLGQGRHALTLPGALSGPLPGGSPARDIQSR
jgi:hypothetical protein